MALTQTLADVPNDAWEQLYAHIGALVVNWALLETSFNLIIAIIYHDIGGKEIDDKLPVAFKRKAKFLRLCFNRIDALKPYADRGLSIVNRAAPLATTRTTVVHSAIRAYDKDSDTFTFLKLDVVEQDTIHKANTATKTLSDIRDAGAATLALAAEATILVQSLKKAFVG